MFIRLATGNKRLILLALGGVFLLCGLILPGPAPKPPAAVEDDEEFVEAEIDVEEEAGGAEAQAVPAT